MYTLTSAKGSFTGTLTAICNWQAEMQAAFASIQIKYPEGDTTEVGIDNIDFDPENLEPAIAAVTKRVAACEALKPAHVEYHAAKGNKTYVQIRAGFQEGKGKELASQTFGGQPGNRAEDCYAAWIHPMAKQLGVRFQ